MTTTTSARRRTGSTAVAVLVAGTFFMELLDGTILATAAPAMGRDLGVDSAAIGIAITAYLVTLAVCIPVSGWLTDRIGSRTVFVGAIAVFTIASGLCAASNGLVDLTIWRIVQGIGGALMVPVGRLVVLRSAGKDQLVTAIAILTWPALAAPIIAPFIGGVLVDTLTWHWIFLVNIPLGVIALVAALVLVPQERAPQRVPFDWRGSLLACFGLGALVVMASLLALDTVPVVAAVVAGVVGAVCTWLAIRHFRRAPHPIMGLDAFRLETFRVSHAGGSLFRLAVSAVPFVLPLLFQDAWGWTALEAGSAVLWVFVGNLGIKPATTPFLRWFGYRPVIIVSSAVAAATVVAMAFLTPATPFWVLAVLLVVSGAARSVGFTAYNTIAFADVEQADMTPANTLSSTLQQTAAGFGVAVAAVVIRAAAGLGGSGPYAVAFWVIAVLLVVACVEGIVMSRTAGDTIRPVRRVRA
ncbi:EmrB/QacA subfamily drug resistance transporter [Curtobacterium sp. PhB130]|uniref:MFS transporter n=1 Tax=unclassified Curtobacterium TaxID=257496 RepID=UPI000FA848DF|nr:MULTISPECIES: MFS transporter [unclassified Curtobacterium]ROS76136.1 EmrB/QacA subfamily drug resistance transporter [Curtobacterium sp. PhB130]TCK64167.1 EmrB/QacA subfamily drug resistance transporter [Curtobacterium sp. PhB136]